MKKILFFLQGLCLVTHFTKAMEPYIYKKADCEDTTGIVRLIDKQAINDRDKIVILPKKFRTVATQESIEHGKLFIARKPYDSGVIAYKKLYLPNENECETIMQDEIRALGQHSHLVDSGYFDGNNNKHSLTPQEGIYPTLHNSVVIYNGGDFTSPDHRGKGINTNLTNYAFKQIKNEVIEQIGKKQALQLLLIYGLTKSNSGELQDNNTNRTPGIAQLFASFAQQILCHFSNKDIREIKNPTIYHNRYKAFMPTFDPESTECMPLDDDHSIEGYGNILMCLLELEKEQQS